MSKTYPLLFFLIIFLACSEEQETEKIKIATLKGPSAMGMVKMIDSLNQTSESNIEITIYNEPIQVRKLMLENKVDLAILPTTMGAILYNKDIPYQVAAIPVWGTLHLLGKDTTVNSWNDLKGKKINLMAKGMTPDVLFRYLLLKNNINSKKDLMLDYSFPTHIDLANAMSANQTEMAVVSEPMVSMIMKNNKEVYPIFDLNTEWLKVHSNIAIAQTALLVHSELSQNKRDALSNILKSYKNSTDWVNQNPELAAKLIVKYNILPSEDIALTSIPRSNLHFELAENIKNQITEYLKIFYDLDPDIVGGKIPNDNFYMN